MITIAGMAFALQVANLDFIPGTSYGPLKYPGCRDRSNQPLSTAMCSSEAKQKQLKQKSLSTTVCD